MRIIERLRAGAARPGARVVARRVALTIAVISVSYLGLANLMLRGGTIRELVSAGPDVELSYDSAYSVWPGRVRFERLKLVAADHNVQLAINVDAGSVDVSLHELLFKRFRAVALTLDGLSFRMRHKVPAVEEESRARIEAYPPIDGYPDPPLYTGPKPASKPGEEDALWRITLEGIRAGVSELWIQEFRYVGPGQVDGGFDLAPGRAFEVFPAHVKLSDGRLTLGSRAVAESFTLGVAGEIAYTETDQGARSMVQNARIQLELASGATDLSLLGLYLGSGTITDLEGQADLDAHLELLAGSVSTSSRAALRLNDASVSTVYGRLVGGAALELGLPAANLVEMVATSSELRFENDSGHKPPTLEAGKLTLRLAPADLTSPLSLRHLLVELPRVTIPSLGWSDGLLRQMGTDTRVGGRLDGEATLGFTPPAGLSARARLRLLGGELEREGLRAALSGHFNLELEPEAPDASLSTGRLDIELDGVEVASTAQAKGKPFRVALRAPDLHVNVEPEPKLSGKVTVHAAPADPLLSLVLGSPLLEELAASVLDLERLEVSARMRIDRRSARLELSHAASGALKGEGFWQRPTQGEPNGAFLVTSDVANVGLVLRGSETETALFVADDWLTRRASGEARPAPRKAPRSRPRKPAP